MPSTKVNVQSFSPLLRVLQRQIVPWVREGGMENVIVAAPSWRRFQHRDAPLPEAAFVTHQPLKSKRVPVRVKALRSSINSLIDARWPEDGLCSTRVPVLMYVLAGAVAIPLGDYVVHCLPGQAVLMPAGTPRPDGSLLCLDETRMNNDYCSMFSLMPWAGGVECWINHSQRNKSQHSRHSGEHCHVLHALAHLYLETLGEEAVAQNLQAELHCDGLLLGLTAILIREIQQQRAFHPVLLGETSIDPAAQHREQNPIKRARIYINAHLHESLSIDQVAAHSYISRAYFTRQFQQVTGKTFVEYVTECRLERAKVLLANTNWTLQRISNSLGISPGRLRSIFLQYLQQTPGDFRRENKY